MIFNLCAKNFVGDSWRRRIKGGDRKRRDKRRKKSEKMRKIHKKGKIYSLKTFTPKTFGLINYILFQSLYQYSVTSLSYKSTEN